MDNWGIVLRLPKGLRYFSVVQNVPLLSGNCLEYKTGFEVNHFSASGVELRKEWIYTSSPMYGFVM
jgi:hypothetical protein